MSSRLTYIDFAKGIAILCLIISHCQTDINSPIKIWIFAWHMPIFFVVCGYLRSLKKTTETNRPEITTWLTKRIRQLWVPYIVWCILSYTFYQILRIYSGEPISNNAIINILTLKGIDSMWFIPIYFFSESIHYLIIIKHQLFVRIICCTLLLGLIVFINEYEIGIERIRIILKVISAEIFVIFGGIIGEMSYYFKKIRQMPNTIIISVALITGTYISHINGFSSINQDFNDIFLYYISAFLLSFSIIQASEAICCRHNKLISFLSIFGANSIVILCTNNLVIEVFRLIEFKYLNSVFLNNGDIGAILMAIIISIIEYLIIAQCPPKFLWLFGKMSKQLR